MRDNAVFRRTDTGFSESNCTLTANTADTQAAVDTTSWTLTHIQFGMYDLDIPLATVDTAWSLVDNATGLITADGVMEISNVTASNNAALALEANIQGHCYDAMVQYDVSHSQNLPGGSAITVGQMIGTAFLAGPRTPTTVHSIFDNVRLALSDVNENLYKDAQLVVYYNRAVQEIWSLMIAYGAEVLCEFGTLVSDGMGTDFELPPNFRAFVPNAFYPRSPLTAVANFKHGAPLQHVGIFDPAMNGSPSVPATPRCFAIFKSGESQYVRFSDAPPAGERYDFQYYPETVPVTVSTVNSGVATTPWLGLCDPLITRVLEEFCREGLEYVTTKREQWRVRASGDLVALLTLRHVIEHRVNPSALRGIPR